MDSSVSPKDEIWFLRVCHHIFNWPLLCFVSRHIGNENFNSAPCVPVCLQASNTPTTVKTLGVLLHLPINLIWKLYLNLLKTARNLTIHPSYLTFQILHCDYLSFVCSQNKQWPCFIHHWLIFITVVGSVYRAVRTDSLYKADTFRL